MVGNDSTQIWGDDVLELGIRVGSTTHQFILAVDGRKTDNGNPIASLLVVTRTVPGGWTLEVAVPATALGLTQLKTDQQYPFTFALWDDDLFTYPGQTHMIWRGTDTYTYGPDWGALGAQPHGLRLPNRRDPDTHRHRNANEHRDGDIDANGFGYAHANPHQHGHADADTDCERHTHIDAYSHGYAFANTHRNRYAFGDAPPTTGAIAGTAWLDADGDGTRSADEFGLVDVRIELLQDGKISDTDTTGGDGSYRFTPLAPGTYTVREVQPPWLRFSTTPNEVTVDVRAGRVAVVDFGDWNGRAAWLPLILR